MPLPLLRRPAAAAQALAEGKPDEWSGANPSWHYVGAAERPLLRPFFRVLISNLLMDLGKASLQGS